MDKILRTLPPLLTLAALLVALPARPAAAAAWSGREVKEGDLIRVLNPAKPVGTAAEIRAVELWRSGEDDDEVILGNIREILVDETGTVYLLDQQLNDIKVFSPDGTFLRSQGKSGEGPGEFRQPTTFFFLPDNRIGVVQMMPSKVAVMDREGKAQSDLILPGSNERGMQFIHKARTLGNAIVLGRMVPSFDEGKVTLRSSIDRIDASGNALNSYVEHVDEQDRAGGGMIRRAMGGPGDFARYWEIGSDGRVYVSPDYTGYRIEVYHPDGKRERVIEREYAPVKTSKEEAERIKESMKNMPARFQGAEISVPEFRRDIERIVVRPNHEIWVLTSQATKDAPKGRIGPFDVFDAQGRFQRQASVAADYNHARDDFALVNDRLFVLKEAKTVASQITGGGGGMMIIQRQGPAADADDEDAEALPFSVICYKIPS